MDKKPGRLFDTVAQAMSGIVYAAARKEIAVSVDCPEMCIRDRGLSKRKDGVLYEHFAND